VAPAELEALLLTSDAVADAAVIGVPDAKAGELPKAYIVKQKGHEALDAEGVQAFVKGKVAAYKALAHVEFIDVVPKSAAGKILRKELRKTEEERRAAK
jgi:acyl-coenzyme A synthetase/AMP-(fatty) acid ligase